MDNKNKGDERERLLETLEYEAERPAPAANMFSLTGSRLAIPAMCLFVILLVVITGWKPGGGVFNLSFSSGGVSVRYVDSLPQDYVSPKIIEGMTEDELLLHGTDVFRGTVYSVRIIEINWGGGVRDYQIIAGTEVNETLRGDLKPGDVISILCDVPAGESAASYIAEGAEGIFMPSRLDGASVWEREGESLCLFEVAGFALNDGERFCFIDTPDGVKFARWAYPSLAEIYQADELTEKLRELLR